MKVAALLCGVIGGLAGLVGALIGVGVGALIAGFGGGGEMALDGIGALVMAVVGIVGGAMAIAKPLPAAILMAVAAVLGFIFISIGFFIRFHPAADWRGLGLCALAPGAAGRRAKLKQNPSGAGFANRPRMGKPKILTEGGQ